MLKQYPQYPNFNEVCHPLVQHKLSVLRSIETSSKAFKELVREISLLLAYEATKGIPITTAPITTPLESYDAPIIAGKKPVILPILRAGTAMVDAFLSLMPSARVGHIGFYRDEETLLPHFYYFKIPKQSQDRHFYICDPMLATGGSAIETVKRLKAEGVTSMTFICIVAAPEGVKKFIEACPDVPIYAASLDRQLNEHGYILPGLGDAGDRCFGTK